GGLHEPVEPRADEEAHMVSAADVVDARVGDPRQECPGGLWAPLKQVEGWEDADPGRCGGVKAFPHRVRRRARGCPAAHVFFAHWLSALRWDAPTPAGDGRWPAAGGRADFVASGMP